MKNIWIRFWTIAENMFWGPVPLLLSWSKFKTYLDLSNFPLGIFANNEGLELSKNYTWHRSLNEEHLTDVKYTSIGITLKTDVYLSIEVLCPKWEDSLQCPWDKGQVNSPTLLPRPSNRAKLEQLDYFKRLQMLPCFLIHVGLSFLFSFINHRFFKEVQQIL